MAGLEAAAAAVRPDMSRFAASALGSVVCAGLGRMGLVLAGATAASAASSVF
jgi:hypothetical protein